MPSQLSAWCGLQLSTSTLAAHSFARQGLPCCAWRRTEDFLTAFDALQSLSDGTFHKLCDALLLRVDTRYRLLRPHGVNSEGQSIKGQPDSFVGESASVATVAFCYSTQKRSWWVSTLPRRLKAAHGSWLPEIQTCSS